MDLARAKFETLKIKVTIEFEGGIFKGEIDRNESFCVDLIRGIRNGKNPIDVLAFLAEEGGKNLGPLGSNPIAEMNRIGPWKWNEQEKTHPNGCGCYLCGGCG